MSSTGSTLERLRQETHAIHARVEALPFFVALHTGLLPRAAYVSFLEAMTTIHESLELAAARGRDPVLAACWAAAQQRLPLLQQDLAHFQAERAGGLSQPLLPAIRLAEAITLRERRDPASLVGSLYVLQGSALGGLVLRPLVAHTIGLSRTDGLAYLTGNARQTRRSWTTFTTAMNTVVQEPALQQRVIDGALEGFEGLEQTVGSLYASSMHAASPRGSTLNPGVESHDITNDPRAI